MSGSIFHALYRFFHFIRIRLIRHIWNLNPNVHIAHGVYFGRNVRILINPDGYKTGGTVTISRGVRIADGVIIAPYGGSVNIATDVFVGPYCVLYGHGGLTIGENTMIATHSVFIPANHQIDDLDRNIAGQGESRLGIEIQEDVWIGSAVKILDGVCIGKGAVIGAGAVVTNSIDPYSVAVGVPARVIRHRGKIGG